jgi:type II secretory pathway component PulF
MLFGTTASLDALILWCRALKHGLDVGLSPIKIFTQQAKSGPSELRPVASRVADRLETGSSLEEALKLESSKFPPMFLEMVSVGEHAGRLTDVFAELEDYFQGVKEARRAFLRTLIWPLIQYFGAIIVLFLMLFVMGLFGIGMDPLGLGLTGTGGAFAFLIGALAFTATVYVVVQFVANSPQVRAKVESVGLSVPGLASCFRALALSRFCIAYYMAAEAGMRADRCLRFSLRACSNKAYTREAEWAAKTARKGEDIPGILGALGTRLFPDEFMGALHVGEDTGRLAEVMKKQADYYRGEARRKMRTLALIAGGLVYLAIGVLLIVIIFKIALSTIVAPYQDAMNASDDPQKWMRQK